MTAHEIGFGRLLSELAALRRRAEQSEALALTLQAQRDQAEADNAALRDGMRAYAEAAPDERGALYHRLFVLTIAEHPGAQLLAERAERAEAGANVMYRRMEAIRKELDDRAPMLEDAVEALLTELAAARAVVAALRGIGVNWPPLNDAIRAYDAVAKVRTESGAAVLAELALARTALDQIDRHVCGACESGTNWPEPCEECGEMREIAAQALQAMKKARAE